MKRVEAVYVVEGFHEETQQWMLPSRKTTVTKIHSNKSLAINRAKKDAQVILHTPQGVWQKNFEVPIDRQGFSKFRVREALIKDFKTVFEV